MKPSAPRLLIQHTFLLIIQHARPKAKGGQAAHFGIARWPKKNYGKFYDGDSYIVLKAGEL